MVSGIFLFYSCLLHCLLYWLVPFLFVDFISFLSFGSSSGHWNKRSIWHFSVSFIFQPRRFSVGLYISRWVINWFYSQLFRPVFNRNWWVTKPIVQGCRQTDRERGRGEKKQRGTSMSALNAKRGHRCSGYCHIEDQHFFALIWSHVLAPI